MCKINIDGLRNKDHYLPDWNISTPTYGSIILLVLKIYGLKMGLGD